MEEIHGSSVLILGFGREGKSVYTWLHKHYPKLKIDVADVHLSPEIIHSPLYSDAIFFQGKEYLTHVFSYETIIRSPGVSPYLPQMVAYIQNGGHVTSATNIFFSTVTGKTIGITGTKGKSTTTSLIAHLVSAQHADVRCVGNIGSPMLDALDTSNSETTFVIELSSHQLIDCRYSPHIAVMLNIVPEHLDYYPDFEMYTHAKANITKHQTANDVFVYNPDNSIVKRFSENTKAQLVPYGEAFHENYYAFIQQGMLTTIRDNESVQILPLSDIPLLGNTENILAATAVASIVGLSAQQMRTMIMSFTSLPHRLEYIGKYKGVSFYNDSLSTIPQATIHALKALGSSVATLIAGGYDRHVDYSALGVYLQEHPVTTLILFPDTGTKIWNSIDEKYKGKMSVYNVANMEEAVRLAFAHTPKGTICVLSPGSASYNMFRDYADRGEQFKMWVQKIGL